MNLRPVVTALLALLLAVSLGLLWLALPNWLLALPALAFAAALALQRLRRSSAYSIGLAGLFLLFVFAVAYVVGDAEEPSLGYVALPRYVWLVVVSVAFLALASIFKRAQSQFALK